MLLMSGLDASTVARRLGHSVQTLLTTYTHWIDLGEDRDNARIDALFTEAMPVTSENASHGPRAAIRRCIATKVQVSPLITENPSVPLEAVSGRRRVAGRGALP
jgi:hypothetical protein